MSVEMMRGRISMLIAHTRGAMPITMTCASEEEAALARRLLDLRRGPRLISVVVTPSR
jgi:hypothetical protein